jgi:uncharacterized protein (DUF983 family)
LDGGEVVEQKPATERLAELQLKKIRDRNAANVGILVGFFVLAGLINADIAWSTVFWGTLGATLAVTMLVSWLLGRAG